MDGDDMLNGANNINRVRGPGIRPEEANELALSTPENPCAWKNVLHCPLKGMRVFRITNND
jgi:hypothetical protein